MKNFLKFVCYLLIFVILITGLYIVKEKRKIDTVEFSKPALLSANYDVITYNDKQYMKIEPPSKELTPALKMNMEHWIGVRIDGRTKKEQFYGNIQALEMNDKDGNNYLWLLLEYDDIYTESGEYKNYSDFNDPLVYIMK